MPYDDDDDDDDDGSFMASSIHPWYHASMQITWRGRQHVSLSNGCEHSRYPPPQWLRDKVPLLYTFHWLTDWWMNERTNERTDGIIKDIIQELNSIHGEHAPAERTIYGWILFDEETSGRRPSQIITEDKMKST